MHLSGRGGGGGEGWGRLSEAHVGREFDILNLPQGGKFDPAAILKSGRP